MKLTIVVIGKLKDKHLAALQADYCKRLGAFAKCEVIEIKDEANFREERPGERQKILEREAKRALAKIKPGAWVVLLDLHGHQWTSEAFAEQLAAWQLKASELVFVIGGSLGVGEALIRRADARWQLSRLTFTHLMTRVLALEQIYRGLMIDVGRKYHK